MSIWNKVLLWLIGFASLGFFYLAVRTLQTHSYYLSTATAMKTSIGNTEEKTGLKSQVAVLKKDKEEMLLKLHKLLVDRPKVWENCAAQVKVDQAKATATVTAAINLPSPHGIAANSVLYAFGEPAEGKPGQFLGEFNVTKADDKQVTLVSAYPLTPLDMKKLDAARSVAWTFCDFLSQDNHEALASLTDEQKKSILPADTVDELIKDGKPADEKDPKELVDGNGNYVRRLRDYGLQFNFARRQNTILYDEIESVKRDKSYIEDGLADVQRQVQFAQNQVTESRSLLEKKKKEVDAVKKVRTLLEEKLASIAEAVNRLIEENKAMAGQIAEKQLEATRRIDARTRAMAKNASGEK